MQQIPFTKQQFEVLLKLVYLGNWMANANKVPGEKRSEYEDLENYIFSFAKSFGLKDLIIEEDPEINECQDEYDSHTFWDCLCEQFANKDAVQEHGEQKLRSMSPHQFFEIMSSLEEKYRDFFSQYGLEKVYCSQE